MRPASGGGGRPSARGHALVGVGVEGGGHITSVEALGRVPRMAEVAIASLVGRPRGDLVSPYDPRYVSLRPTDLAPLIDRLVAAVDPGAVDAVLAISESGVVPAYAFAAAIDVPLVVATDVEAELPQAIAFEVGEDPRSGQATSRRIYPLSTGERVIVVEHHTLTGDSVLSCVGALRAEGIACHHVATLLAADDPLLFARLASAGLELHAAALLPGAITRLLYRHGEPPA